MRELIKRGWVEDAPDERALESSVLRFLKLGDVDQPLPQAANFRCSPARTPDERGLYAWTRRVEILAGQQVPSGYSRAQLEADIPDVLEMAQRPEQVGDVPEALLALGVRCVVVPRLEKTYADGVPLAAVEAFAASIGRHPGIVVGRLHFDGGLNYKYLRQTLARVSPHLEGWLDRPMPA